MCRVCVRCEVVATVPSWITTFKMTVYCVLCTVCICMGCRNWGGGEGILLDTFGRRRRSQKSNKDKVKI